MYLQDFSSETLELVLDKLIERTNNDVIEWTSNFPIPLDDPNNTSYSFEIDDGTGNMVNVVMEQNYDPICMGDVVMFYWFDENDYKNSIPLDYTNPKITNLLNAIRTQTYRMKIADVNNDVASLNSWLGN